MSGNAYRLKISEHTDKRGNRGLDLNIYDKIWGKERPTGTLSGGETFIVALSLAQGLAELIQSQIGGVEINSIFIDEGFGSLNEDSLAEENVTEPRRAFDLSLKNLERRIKRYNSYLKDKEQFKGGAETTDRKSVV